MWLCIIIFAHCSRVLQLVRSSLIMLSGAIIINYYYYQFHEAKRGVLWKLKIKHFPNWKFVYLI